MEKLQERVYRLSKTFADRQRDWMEQQVNSMQEQASLSVVLFINLFCRRGNSWKDGNSGNRNKFKFRYINILICAMLNVRIKTQQAEQLGRSMATQPKEVHSHLTSSLPD
jgi:hypothetical protein